MSEIIKSELRRKEVAARTTSLSKSAQTKNAILSAAMEFLKSRPFRDLTVGILMADTGCKRSTFYQYFNDLHSLMEALLDRVKVRIIEGAQPWLNAKDDPVDDLQSTLKALVDVGYEEGSILKAVADAATSDARLEHVWESFLCSFDEVVAARMVEDQALGLIPLFDPHPVARALNRMDAALLISAFGTTDKSDKSEVLAALRRIWLSTLYPFATNAARPNERN